MSVAILTPAAANGSLQADSQPAPSSVPELPTETRWAMPLPAAPVGPAAVADGQVLVALQSGLVVAHGIADGVERWRGELAAGQPLATLEEKVFVAAGAAVHALRAPDGSLAWRSPTGTIDAPLLAQDGWIIAVSGGRVMALRATDGTVVWQREIGETLVQPSIEGDFLYLPRADGRVQSLVLATGADRWMRRLGGPPTEVLALADRVFVGSSDRHLYALDARDGSITWRFRVGAALRGRPAAAGALVLAAALDNLVRAFDRHSGARTWDAAVPYRPIAGPLVSAGSIVVPGPTRELPSFDTARGTRGTVLKLPAILAAPVTAATVDGGPALVALTGDASVGWTVSLLRTPFGLRVAPLTSLPGTIVPIQIPRIPTGPS